MIWVSIIASLVLFFSIIGGVRDGAIKAGFSLLITLIAIPVAGSLYDVLARLLSFLPGDNWENLVGFFVTLAVLVVILQLVFLLPRKLIQKMWPKGFFYRLIGGFLNLINSAIGLVVFALVLAVYPIWGWLAQAVTGSGVIIWLVTHLGFVQSLLPEIFRISRTFVAVISCF
jgi:uncharacterized membrane protein required for colicin V production